MLLNGYDLAKAENIIEKVCSFTLSEKMDWQNDHKWKLAKFHYDNNDYYRSKIKGPFPNRWESLPIMQKKDYQKKIEFILSNGYSKKNTYVANTSGSTGVPFFFAKNKFAHAMSWSLAENRYNWQRIKLASRQARYFGSPLENKGRYFEKIKDILMNRKRMLVFDLSDKALERHIIFFKKIKFQYIYGYTSALVIFARYLLKTNQILKNMCPSLKVCITTSEVLTIEDREILTLAFGIMIVNEYGVSEAGGIVAFENNQTDWILSCETQFIEIVNGNGNVVKNGQEGKILITDLHNKAMPFIRYEVGDIGVLKSKGNLGHLVLDKLIGRTNDEIILPSGKIAPGLTFYYISRSILESFGILQEFVIKQESLYSFKFEIVSSRNLYKHEVELIKQKMDVYLEKGLKIKIKRVKKIKRSQSGKLKHFSSYLNE